MASMSQTVQTGPVKDPIVVTAKRETAQETGHTTLFGQALDAVNPLQHVPGVSQGYRALTGDKISTLPKLIGHVGLGAAVAGPIGAAAGAGVFLLESGIELIGKLFSGSHGGPAKQAAALTAKVEAQAAPVAATAKVAQGAILPAVKGAWPQLSSEQFSSLVSAFGPAPAPQAEATNPEPKSSAPVGSAPGGQDLAAQIRANLAKYDAMQMQQVALRKQDQTQAASDPVAGH